MGTRNYIPLTVQQEIALIQVAERFGIAMLMKDTEFSYIDVQTRANKTIRIMADGMLVG